MLFVLTCMDKPNSVNLRLQTRPAHVEWLGSLGDTVKLAGPFLNDMGEMVGTMAVIEAPDRGAAEAIAAQDPYAKAGLFQTVDIRAWRWALKNPEAS